MPTSLPALEAERDTVRQEMAQIGDMRRGSITETFRTCGKDNCACSQADHPGHGPYYAFTTKVAGKTKTIQLRAGSRLTKFQREVDAYRRFKTLSKRLLELNEAICDKRSEEDKTPAEQKALKKTSRGSSRRKSRRR
jgi:hypothetical protein